MRTLDDDANNDAAFRALAIARLLGQAVAKAITETFDHRITDNLELRDAMVLKLRDTFSTRLTTVFNQLTEADDERRQTTAEGRDDRHDEGRLEGQDESGADVSAQVEVDAKDEEEDPPSQLFKVATSSKARPQAPPLVMDQLCCGREHARVDTAAAASRSNSTPQLKTMPTGQKATRFVPGPSRLLGHAAAAASKCAQPSQTTKRRREKQGRQVAVARQQEAPIRDHASVAQPLSSNKRLPAMSTGTGCGTAAAAASGAQGLIQPQPEPHSLTNATMMKITARFLDMLSDDVIPYTALINLARDLQSELYGLGKMEATAISTSTSAANTLAAAKLAQDSAAKHAEAAKAESEFAE